MQPDGADPFMQGLRGADEFGDGALPGTHPRQPASGRQRSQNRGESALSFSDIFLLVNFVSERARDADPRRSVEGGAELVCRGCVPQLMSEPPDTNQLGSSSPDTSPLGSSSTTTEILAHQLRSSGSEHAPVRVGSRSVTF
jgi:hypothetical protein